MGGVPLSLSSSRPRERCRSREPWRRWPALPTSSVTYGSGESGSGWRRRSRAARGSRRGPSCSDTSSEAARRPPMTESSRRASESRQSTPSRRVAGGRCRLCAGTGSSSCRSPTPSPSSAPFHPRTTRLRRRFWASGLALVASGLSLGACGTAGISGSSRATVYVSAPLRGPAGADGRHIVDGARMALAAAGGRVGKLAVRARYLDDAAGSGDVAGWSPSAVGANARAATEDTSSVAYIGDFQSNATRTSEPITNAAHLLQVSPASGGVDLTRPFLGSDEVPVLEEEGGARTFGRVIPDDAAQAAAAAEWVRKLGA